MQRGKQAFHSRKAARRLLRLDQLEHRLLLAIGPDAFGYFAESTPPIAVDLTPGTPGTLELLTHVDDSTQFLSLDAHTFSFYGQTWTELSISSNGILTFDGADNSTSGDLTSFLPTIAVLWRDWESRFSSQDMVLARFDDTNGDATADRLIVEWNEIRLYNQSGTSPVTFQAILELDTGTRPGTILFNYPDLVTGVGGSDEGQDATIGIKAAGFQADNRLLVGTAGNNSALVGTGKAIRIATLPPAPPIAVASISPADAATISGPEAVIDVQFNVPPVGVDTTDLVLSGAASVGSLVESVLPISENVWRFRLQNLAPGELHLALAPDPGDIVDAYGQDLDPRPTAWSYTVVAPNEDFIFSSVAQASGTGIDRFELAGDYLGRTYNSFLSLGPLATTRGKLFAANLTTGEILQFSAEGGYERVFVNTALGVNRIAAIEADVAGNLYVAASSTPTTPPIALRYDQHGNLSGIFSDPDVQQIYGIDADAAGNVYLLTKSTYDASQLEIFTPAGAPLDSQSVYYNYDTPVDMAIDEIRGLVFVATSNFDYGRVSSTPAYNRYPDYLRDFYAPPGELRGISYDIVSNSLLMAIDGNENLVTVFDVQAGYQVPPYPGYVSPSSTGIRDAVRVSPALAVDLVRPTVVSITPPIASTVTGGSIAIDIKFSEPIVGFDANDLYINDRAAAGAVLSQPDFIGDNTYRVFVSGLTSNGNLELRLNGYDITDTTGNALDPVGVDWHYSVVADQSPGSLDLTFAGGGRRLDGDGGYTTVLPDGQILTLGLLNNSLALRRLLTNGVLDTSFGNSGLATAPLSGFYSLESPVVQADGKILVAGTDGVGFVVVRFASNGLLDPSFGSGGIVRPAFGTPFGGRSLTIQSDGKILVGGSASLGGTQEFALARLLTNGTPDMSFGTAGITVVDVGQYNSFIADIDLASDGSILAAGQAAVNNSGVYGYALARFLTNGQLDTSFGTAGRVITRLDSYTDDATNVVVLNSGKILVGGYSLFNGGGSFDFTVLRYLPNGQLDASFAAAGVSRTDFFGSIDSTRDMLVAADGRIYLAGDASRYSYFNRSAVVCLRPDGSPDPGFGYNGRIEYHLGYGPGTEQFASIGMDPQGRIILGGSAYAGDTGAATVVRLNAFGPAVLMGDANQDGVVDGADYTAWADHFLQNGGRAEGDFSGDGFVDGADYSVWADHFGVANANDYPPPGVPLAAATASALAAGPEASLTTTPPSVDSTARRASSTVAPRQDHVKRWVTEFAATLAQVENFDGPAQAHFRGAARPTDSDSLAAVDNWFTRHGRSSAGPRARP